MSVLVSVVITTYKRTPEMIEKSIFSVLNQTYSNLELLIIDDSPETYDQREKVREFCEGIPDNRVKYIQHKKNMGACVARNTGISASNGTVIGFLDDDDEWLPEKIESMLPLFSGDNVGIVYANAQIIESNGKTRNYFDRYETHEGNVYDDIMRTNFIGSTSFPLLNKEALVSVGGFDPGMEASQDWDTWIRMSQKYEVRKVDKVLTNYYMHSGIRITSDTKKRIRALRHLDEKNIVFLRAHKAIYRKHKEYELRLCMQAGLYKDASLCYFQAVKLSPFSLIGNLKLLKAFGRIVFKRKEGTY